MSPPKASRTPTHRGRIPRILLDRRFHFPLKESGADALVEGLSEIGAVGNTLDEWKTRHDTFCTDTKTRSGAMGLASLVARPRVPARRVAWKKAVDIRRMSALASMAMEYAPGSGLRRNLRVPYRRELQMVDARTPLRLEPTSVALSRNSS